MQQIKVALYEFKAHTKHARTSIHESSHENHVRIKIILQTAISNVRHKNWSLHSHILLENELLLTIEYVFDWDSIKNMNDILICSILLYHNLITKEMRCSNYQMNSIKRNIITQISNKFDETFQWFWTPIFV